MDNLGLLFQLQAKKKERIDSKLHVELHRSNVQCRTTFLPTTLVQARKSNHNKPKPHEGIKNKHIDLGLRKYVLRI